MGPSSVHNPVHDSFGSSRIWLGDLFGSGTADSGGLNAATVCGTNKLELTFTA